VNAEQITTVINKMLQDNGYRLQVTYDREIIVTNHPYITKLGDEPIKVDEAKL